jgi:hypothetical protein
LFNDPAVKADGVLLTLLHEQINAPHNHAQQGRDDEVANLEATRCTDGRSWGISGHVSSLPRTSGPAAVGWWPEVG